MDSNAALVSSNSRPDVLDDSALYEDYIMDGENDFGASTTTSSKNDSPERMQDPPPPDAASNGSGNDSMAPTDPTQSAASAVLGDSIMIPGIPSNLSEDTNESVDEQKSEEAATNGTSTGNNSEHATHDDLEEQNRTSDRSASTGGGDPAANPTPLEFLADNVGMPPVVVHNPDAAVMTTVTPRRKDELLLKARRERLQWIQQVPLPYEKDANAASVMPAFFRFSHASQHLPAATKILHHLYGHETSSESSCSDRVDTLLNQTASTAATTTMEGTKQYVYLTGNQILAAELEVVAGDDEKNKPKAALLKSYQSFLLHLQDPACGLLVQGMRNFCRTFADVTETETAARRLRAYLAETLQTLQQHEIFAHRQETDQLRRSLESFLFGHVRSHLDQLYCGQPAAAMTLAKKDEAFQERLQLLQFITPQHLDIACLASNNNSNDDEIALDELLAEAVEALRAVDSYHSVYEKLQSILGIYRGVNKALTLALNRGGDRINNNNNHKQKLPSADDVLPTIILTVLVARPARLLVNLQLVEELSPAEYLRGEAGYAFTNLLGAVQFLQDLNLETSRDNNNNQQSSTMGALSITPQAFRDGIAASKAAVAQKLQQRAPDKNEQIKTLLPALTPADDVMLDLDTKLPPLGEIRRARLEGETVDVAWALRWQQENSDEDIEKPDNDTLLRHSSDSFRNTQQHELLYEKDQGLPRGFRRQYSFLAKRPEDIRVSDLPLLLEEYRMLVRTTETLLGERALKASAARKAKTLAMEKELMHSVGLVDKTLLPPSTNEHGKKASKK